MFNSYIMSPPEVWGPAVWRLFHTLIEKMNPNAYPKVIGPMFSIIIKICKVLPCPECSRDASNFLAKIKLSDYKTKDDFKNMLYLFHNWVNAKKRKQLFNYSNINIYANMYLPNIINDFIAKYNTKGNMKLLTESFQRGFVIKDLLAWFKAYSPAFVKPLIYNNPKQINKEIEPNSLVIQEPVVEQEPEIIVEKQEPEIIVEKQEPEIIVEKQEPEIIVEKQEPEVEQKPEVIEEENEVEQKPEVVEEPEVEQKPEVVEENEVEQKPEVVEEEPEVVEEEPEVVEEPVVVEEPEVVENEVIIQKPKKKKNKSKK
jgi:hypothetical protein